VSVAAGVLALTSAVAVLRGHELTLALVCVLLIAVANLRGVKEAGLLFALPTYAFVTSIFMLIGVGLTKCATSGCPQAAVQHPAASGTGALTLFIVLRAFASGSTALTGVEAIANGVSHLPAGGGPHFDFGQWNFATGSDGSPGRGGSIAVTYDPQVKPYLDVIRLSNPGGPRPVYKEEPVAALW